MTEPTYDRAGDARRALCDVINGYGPAAADDARLVGSLLSDLLPGEPPEARLLQAAASFRVVSMLRDRIPAMPPDSAVRDVAALLAAREALDARACLWVVGEYALALGYPLAGTSAGPGPSVPQPPDPGRPTFPSPQHSPQPPYSPQPQQQYSPQPQQQYSPQPQYSPQQQYGVQVPIYPTATVPWRPAGGNPRGRIVAATFFLFAMVLMPASAQGQTSPYVQYAFATAAVFLVTAVLLLNSRTAAIGEGAAIGVGLVTFGNTLIVFGADAQGGHKPPVIIAILLVALGAVIAFATRQPVARAPQTPGWLLAGIAGVVLWIITDNLPWIGGEFGESCCSISDDSGWQFSSDLVQLIVACALLLAAAISGPNLRSVGVYLGVAVAGGVGVKFVVLTYAAYGDSTVNWTVGGWLRLITFALLIVAGLVGWRRQVARPAPVYPPGPPPPAGYTVADQPRPPGW